MSTETAKTRDKMCYEELLDKFKEAADHWLKDTPEARGLMLVVDWKVGQNDFPPCSVVCYEPTEQSILDMMKQTLKLLNHISLMFRQQIEKVTSILAQATEFVEKQQAHKPIE